MRCSYSEGGRRCVRNAVDDTNPPLCNTHIVVVAGFGQPQPQGSAVFEVLDDLLSGERVTRGQVENAVNELFGSFVMGGNIAQGYYPPVDGPGSGQRRGARGGQASPGFHPPSGFRPPPGWPFGVPWGHAQQQEPEDPQQAELEAACWRARQVLGFAQGEPIDREKLKNRHRELVKKYHPDRPGGDLAKMQAINEAVDVLESVMP